MSPFICGHCGFLHGSRMCKARAFIDSMEGAGYARIPYRRWTRRFKKAGIHVVHGDISVTHTGNWAPRPFVEALIENRRRSGFRTLPFHRQVEEVVCDVMIEELLTQDS